jgi:hypothetical protein
MFRNLFARTKRTAPKAQLHVEALEDRWAPAHLGVKEVLLPPAANHGAQGIAQANDTPTHVTPGGEVVPHSEKMILIFV